MFVESSFDPGCLTYLGRFLDRGEVTQDTCSTVSYRVRLRSDLQEVGSPEAIRPSNP